MTAAAGHGQPPGVGSEAETTEQDDETLGAAADTAAGTGGGEPQVDDPWTRSPLADLPSGTAFGTLVHAVLENVDTDSADLPGELLVHCAEQLTRHPVDTTAGLLAEALLPVLHTPLGPLADGVTWPPCHPGIGWRSSRSSCR